MIDFYLVFSVHDDDGDTTIYRCLKSFANHSEASNWAYSMRRKVHDRTLEHFDPLPFGFIVEDLDSIEVTVHPHDKWIEQLKKAADDIEKYVAENDDDEDDALKCNEGIEDEDR